MVIRICGYHSSHLADDNRGWLYLPAIGLVLTILANMISINFTIRFLMENIAQIGHAQKGILFFELFAFIGMLSYGIFVKSVNCRITILHLCLATHFAERTLYLPEQ